MMNNVEVVVCA